MFFIPSSRSATAWFAAFVAAALAPATQAQFAEPDVSVLYTLTSDQPGDGFGFVADAIGDLNGDGASEIIIGANRNTAGGTGAGKAFVFSGRTGTLLNTVTGAPFNQLGWGVAGVGDINNDGVPDYAVSGTGTFGAPAPQLGRLLVLSGATHAVLLDRNGPVHLSFFGYDIGAAGDVNEDGHDDIIVGAPFHTVGGAVHFISGKDGSTIRAHAGPTGSRFGSAVSRVRDQNHDGKDDHAVGAFRGGKLQKGEGYVLSGTDGSLVRVLEARKTAEVFGNFFVHDAGDVDADGFGDIFVSDFADHDAGPFSGLGYVFYGARDDKRFFRPESAGEGFGPGRGAGDVDRDGHDDLIIAAFVSSAKAPAGGRVFVFSGKNGKIIRTMTGNVPFEQLGFDALPVGDINGDGRIDFLITGQRIAHLVLGNP